MALTDGWSAKDAVTTCTIGIGLAGVLGALERFGDIHTERASGLSNRSACDSHCQSKNVTEEHIDV